MLVVVLDDLGIDNFSFPPFGWDAAPLAPDLPVLAAIAAQGVSFRNFWATPEWSPSRAAMLTGRHGFRTGVVTAIVDPMLPVNQLNPAEITVPKLVAKAGYRTGMIGNHLGGGPENTPPGFGYEAPSKTVGLDFYDGCWDLPPAIDTIVGGQVPEGTFDCGAPGHYEVGIAAGTSLRHDHGSQFISNAFQDELKTLGIDSSPSFVRQPQGNGCPHREIARFIRTLKEQLLWIRPFDSVEQLNLALREFAQRFHDHREHWILGRLDYRTPAQHRRSLLAQAA